MQKNIVPIVFCADDEYADYVPVLLQSIIDNSSSAYKYKVYIFYPEDKEKETIEEFFLNARLVIKNSKNVDLKIVNISRYIKEHCSEFPIIGHISAAMYGRLFIPELLPEFDKILYSDIDVLFNQDIAELIGIQLDDNLIAGVPDIGQIFEQIVKADRRKYINEVLKLSEKYIYINSGILVINVKMWSQESIAEKILSFLKKNKILHLPDQDAINSVCRGRTVLLNQIWSYQMAEIGYNLDKYNPEFVPKFYPAMLKEYRAAGKNPIASIHYTGPFKPWNSPCMLRASEWWSVCRKTPVYEKLIARVLPMLQAEKKLEQVKEYRFLFIPIFKIKVLKDRVNYYLFSRLKIASKKDLLYRTRYYLFGINIFTIKKR